MAEDKDTEEKNEKDSHLPALNEPVAWGKAIAFLAILIAINVVGALVSYGFGVIVTIPLTIFMAFLLGRDLIPRHRFPRGRQPPTAAPQA
ncbi:MAG: hypothetical protein JF616_13125 [Fibrobacteres bacterium]|nr:hypothetical protein [Fibrobacterota bacterium]